MIKKYPILLALVAVLISCEAEEFDIANDATTIGTTGEDLENVDIEIDPDTVSTSCGIPQRLSANEVSNEAINVTWITETTKQTSFEVRYVEQPESIDDTSTAILNDSTLIPAETNNVTIGNLKPLTNYIVIVRTKCSEGTFSQWSESVIITTL
ncbi:fibronectin type III domain-containing protein [Aquimarina sp. AU474]|uniref:fibronectin type III domain-containing protein n=1 Tax=Aquimarina sp. AU474 TaxID=2108529 RepID=UPI000D691990|nr:fibronectin type III domain-containing protein [Aquimarina sp. AU474]